MLRDVFGALRTPLSANEPVALATVLEVEPAVSGAGTQGGGPGAVPGATLLVRTGGSRLGSLGSRGLDEAVARDAFGQLDAGATSLRRYGPMGEIGRQEVAVFVQVFAPPPQMLIFGAVDFAAALARVAKVLGFRVTVCDARAVFATRARFPFADEVVVAWPDRHLASVGEQLGPRDAVCVLTHEPKFDVPAIEAALRTGAGYIGAMGSRHTTAERERQLREHGLPDAALSRLMAPIGLDIGARTPEETAVSICAEIISLRSRTPTSASLSRSDGPIHHEPKQNPM
ncbi:MAG TPA: XdhC/CoxI family protein [Acidimicrobiales bacterium]|nr:XdhC/CoxI family protein [Acidimicrobiales bacterium]